MPDQQLTERVMRVIAQTQRIPPESVAGDSTFEQLQIDSLDAINILFALENEFDVNIPDEEARTVRSVADLAGLIERLCGGASEAAAEA